MLFSDDIDKAKDEINLLNVNYICADMYDSVDEIQFYMMSMSDVIIGCASSYSLVSCYINELFEFNNDSTYIFPDKWFCANGPKYNMNDIIQLNNPKFVITH